MTHAVVFFAAEENLGMHYFQGDVLTTNDQKAKLDHMLDTSSNANSQLHSRALVKDVRRTWEKGIVPYVIKSDVGWLLPGNFFHFIK